MCCLFAGSTDDNAYIERASTFFEIATLLKKLAYTYNLAVLVTNQVSCLAILTAKPAFHNYQLPIRGSVSDNLARPAALIDNGEGWQVIFGKEKIL